MESITSAAEEILVDSLSFKLPGSGQYVQERRSVTFHTEGSNSYSSQAGTRVIRFKLSSEGWLDPSTARFFFDVMNNDPDGGNKKLRPLGAVHAFFRRLRITMRGWLLKISRITTVSTKCSTSYKPKELEPMTERRASVTIRM